MKISRYILSLFFVFFVVSASVGQVPELINNQEFRPHAKAAVDSIYNFNFSAADKIIEKWKEKHPEHPLWLLFDGLQCWWQVISDLEDTSQDAKLYNIMKKANYEARKLLHDKPSHSDGLLIIAISNGFLARQHANREDWITSVNYGRKAMEAHEYLIELQPELNDLKLAEGLKLYYLAYLPEKYPIIRTVSWALPEGDKQKGLEYIRKASREAVFAGAEATYFLGNINYNYEKDYGVAVKNFEKLQAKYPRNNYYARILVKSYYKQQRYDEALSFIEKTLSKWVENDLPHLMVMQEELWTWKGRILEKKGRTEEALESYKKAFSKAEELPNSTSRSFYVVSGYLAGKIFYDQKKFDKARCYLKKTTKADVKPGYRQRAQYLLSKMS